MERYTDIYINLPNKSTLFLYKRLGVLDLNGKCTKIHRDIAKVLQLCLCGMPLYEAINNYRSTDFSKDEILWGLLELIREDKLLVGSKASDEGNVVDEEYVFYPRSIHIELTRTCNLKCGYCYKESGPDVKEKMMPVETLLDVVQKLVDRGLSVVELTGGEPLLHPEFFNILRFCCERLSFVSILTNGVLVDSDFLEKIKPFRSKTVFSISLDSYLAEEHERKSGVSGSFQKTVNAVKMLSDEKFIVRISMAVDESNWNHIEKTLLFAKSIGATAFTYSPVIPVGRAAANGTRLFGADIPFDVVAEQERYLLENYSDFLHVLDGYSQKELNSPGGCGAGSRTFVINPQGKVRMCASFENGYIGDVCSQSLKEIFSNGLCNLSARLVPPNIDSCVECKCFSFCMGCSMRALKMIDEIGVDKCHWASNNKTAKKWFYSMR